MWQILLIEDSSEIVDLVRLTLAEDCSVTAVGTLAEARLECTRTGYDLILLDVMLPDGDGFALCSTLQEDERTQDIPIVFLTAKTDPDDKVEAFTLGADDYVEKPFDRRELRARVAAKLRKNAMRRERTETLSRGNLKLHVPLQKAVLLDPDGERELDLTPHEFKLLFQLMREENRTISREQLMQQVWGNVVVYERTIDSHLSNLRKKLGDRGHWVQSVRGIGYRFSPSSI